MSDPTCCRGKDPDGGQCICLRCTDPYLDDTGRRLCGSCGHIESAHPEPKSSVGSFIRGFRDAGKLGSSSIPAKVSQEEAETEMSAGLRPKKRKSNLTDTEPPPKKTNKGKNKVTLPAKVVPEAKGDAVKFGKLVLIVGGVAPDGTLRDSKVPDSEQMSKMREAKLVVLPTPTEPLVVNTAWSNKRTNKEIKRWLPEPMAYLEQQPYPGDPQLDSADVKNQLWMGCTRKGKILTLAHDELPTGVELADHCKAPGRPISERVLFLASKVKIPQRHWKWGEPESEDLGSDIDTVPSEDIIMTPRKPADKKKLKIKTEPGIDSEDESDMRKAAKKRTRLSTGVLKHKPLFVPGSSDGLEELEEGPSGSTSGGVVVVSDDDEPPPVPTLASVLGLKSASPAPSVAHRSPSPFDFSADFEFESFSPPPQDTPGESSSAGSSTLPASTPSASHSAASTSAGVLFTPTWALPTWSNPIPDTGGGSSNVTLPTPKVPVVGSAAPRFRKMGRGRAHKDPWSNPGAP
ncbi:hypothetical protein B0H19DRAFT_1245297 [Mycena capillaripes]|nr:hypothetical protein B0H19DRAFT_1245297 [Mycena capillaripes]